MQELLAAIARQDDEEAERLAQLLAPADEPALLEALASGKLRAAGLDAFATEPLVGEHAFRAVPNVILSPHIGGVSEDAYVNMGTAAARNVLAVLSQPRPVAA